MNAVRKRRLPNRGKCGAPAFAEADALWKSEFINLHYSEFSRGLPIAISWARPQIPREIHVHDFHEIAVITHGVGMHVSRYASWPVQTGDVLVIGGKQAHYYDDVHELEMVNILFQRECLKLNVQDIEDLDGFHALFGMGKLSGAHEFRSRFRLEPKDLAIILSYIHSLEEELTHAQPGRFYFVNLYFMIIVGMLSRLYSAHHDFDASAALRVAKVINYLEANFAEEHSAEELAQLAGLSERTLQCLFKLAMGQSPSSFLLQLRLSRAAEALRDSSRQITEIAFCMGFNDSNYFSRQFRKRMGCTPQQYRLKECSQKKRP